MKVNDSLSGLATILVHCSNRVESTRQCINALRRYTRSPWELIVIDDGSTDDTATYLASVRGSAPVPVTVIANATRRGVSAAINQGLEVARCEYLVLVSQDVVVTDSWLEQLIGLVNAKRSSVVSGPLSVVEEQDDKAGAFTEEGANDAEGDEKPLVGMGAGSGLRTAPGCGELSDPSCARDTNGSADVEVPAAETSGRGGSWPTPPGPPLHKGGKGVGSSKC